MGLKAHIIDVFIEKFAEPPQHVVRAPGRVNLIGEHTDYNDGFVFPMAIDRAMWIALRPRKDKKVVVWSIDFEEMIEFDLDNMQKGEPHPREYMKGVAWALQEAGHMLTGWDGVMGGDIPIGAGLSSSAAVELAIARSFSQTSGFKWEPAEMALLSQKAENQWVGMQCGIMDQLISASGEEDHALFIDCRSLETTAAPLPKGTVIVVMDTATRHQHVDSAYNERRQQCESASQFFGVPALRDVSLDEFKAKAAGLDDVTRRRAKHIITENGRTQQALTAMRQNDAEQLGLLMNQSHASLRDDFEVTNDALNSISAIAQAHPNCYGARMTGGGFGGCAVALIDAAHVDEFVAVVSKQYQTETEHTPQLYVCQASAGAGIVE
jgi:galactokinase